MRQAVVGLWVVRNDRELAAKNAGETVAREMGPLLLAASVVSVTGPIVAIITQPGRANDTSYTSYLPASYVKWIEMAGARVVPLSFYASDAKVRQPDCASPPVGVRARTFRTGPSLCVTCRAWSRPLADLPPCVTAAQVAETFRSVNGALFPGGSGDLPRAARTMYSLALKANRAGDYFPIWGTCDGFEWLMQVMVVRMPMPMATGARTAPSLFLLYVSSTHSLHR